MQHFVSEEKSVLKERNMYIIFGVTLIAVMGVASITPAFPKIASELGISQQQVGYLISIFTLPGVFLTPVLGVLADRIGRKKILIPALFLFSIAGFLCFFTRDFHTLLAFRFMQGVGAASIGSLNVTLIGDLFSGNRRSTAMGYNASVLSVGTASYPAVGGALATIAWYYPFLLPLLAIPVGLAVLFYLKNPEPQPTQNLKEYLGKAFKGMANIPVLVIFISSVVTFVVIYGAFLTFYPFLIEDRFGSPVYVIGFVMSVSSIFSAITSSQLGKLTKRFSKLSLLSTGFLFYAVTLTTVPYVYNIWLLLIPTAIMGIANGINMPVLQTMLAGMAPIEYRGAFMSVNGMVLRIGQTLGPLFTGYFYIVWGIEGAYLSTFVLVIMLVVLFQFAFRKHNMK